MVKLFTHTDLDGVGCAVLAKLAFGNEVSIEYCDYDEINAAVTLFAQPSQIEDVDMCHITDISVSEAVATRINNEFDNFYLFDHHPTALGLNKFIWSNAQVDNEDTGIKTCGTELYYNWLVETGYLSKSDILQNFVETVRDYDTWRWSTLGESGVICKQINDLLYLYNRERFITWCLSEIHDSVFPRLYAFDEQILSMRQKEIDGYVEEKDKTMIIKPMCGLVCGYVFAERFFSELGNRLCKMHPEIDFVVMVDMDGTISYRTVKDDINLGKDVAKIFGGGGHPKAAGSQFSREIILKTIGNIFGN